MEKQVKTDLDRSATAFRDFVIPAIRPWLGEGDFLQMESILDSHFAKCLDMVGGIDTWFLPKDEMGMIGIATRVQDIKESLCKGYAPWNTFTVRLKRYSGAKTEYEKRLTAIELGKYIYPHLTIQAYVNSWDGPLVSVGMAKTFDIINFIKDGHSFRNSTNNAVFEVCKWQKMKGLGIEVSIKDFDSEDLFTNQ